MNTIQVNMIGTGLFFLLILLSGLWMKKSGKPYSAIKLNIHKFISLGAVAFLIIRINQVFQGTKPESLILFLVVVSGLLVLIALISGGLVSVEQKMPAFVLPLHRVTSFLLLCSTAALFYFLFIR